MRFGQALFSGDRFLFWAIAPALVLTLLVVNAKPVVEWTPAQVAIMAALDVAGLAFLVARADDECVEP